MLEYRQFTEDACQDYNDKTETEFWGTLILPMKSLLSNITKSSEPSMSLVLETSFEPVPRFEFDDPQALKFLEDQGLLFLLVHTLTHLQTFFQILGYVVIKEAVSKSDVKSEFPKKNNF